MAAARHSMRAGRTWKVVGGDILKTTHGRWLDANRGGSWTQIAIIGCGGSAGHQTHTRHGEYRRTKARPARCPTDDRADPKRRGQQGTSMHSYSAHRTLHVEHAELHLYVLCTHLTKP